MSIVTISGGNGLQGFNGFFFGATDIIGTVQAITSTVRTSTQVVYPIGSGEGLTVNGTGFTYDSLGDPQTGTITSYTYRNSAQYGPFTVTVTGLSLSAATVRSLIIAGVEEPLQLLLFGGADTFNATTGPDIIYAHGGDDTINGGDGDDELHGDEPRPGGQAIGVAGNDTINGGAGNDVITGNGGNDTLDGGVGNDNIQGGDGDDVILGGDGNDIINGGAGFDTVSGGAGNDFIGLLGPGVVDGGDGDDFIGGNFPGQYDGGAGFDTASASLASETSDLTIDLTLAATDGGLVLNNNATYRRIESLNFTSGSGNDTIIYDVTRLVGTPPSALLATVDGGAGNDVLVVDMSSATSGVTITQFQVGRPGWGITLQNIERMNATGSAFADTIQGGDGADIFFGGAAFDGLQGNGGNDILHGQGDGDSLSGDDGNDTLYGEDGNDLLLGGNGQDILVGGVGNDYMDGGFDIDTASYADAAAGVTVSLLIASTPQDTIGAGSDTLLNIESLIGSAFDDTLTGNSTSSLGSGNLLDGGDGNDVLNGGEGTDSLLGGAGNDTLDGGAGSDTLDGGAGIDTASYATASASVSVSLAIAGPQDTIGAGVDTLIGIENLTGSAFNDTLAGDAGANILLGGLGDDVLDGGDGVDAASYASASAGVSVNLSLIGAQDTLNAGTDTLANIENLTGSAFGDALTGNGGANSLLGGGGDDVLEGGAGNDTLDGGAGFDVASYAGASAGVIVTLLSGATVQNTVGAGSDTLVGIEGIIGSSFNDILTGNVNGDVVDNLLDGGAGNDVLRGLAGNDTLIGGDGNDTADFNNQGGGVTVSLLLQGVSQNTGSAGGFDTLVSIENLKGSSFNDTLIGDDGNNVLDGGAGNDTLDGGAGVDTASYATATSGVSVSLAAVGAQNTLNAGLDTLIGIENLTGSAFGDNLTGDAGNNTLSGGAGVDTLIGGAGDDVLIGGDNTDFIVDLSGIVSIDGGAGNEQITLGAGVVSGTVDGGLGTDQVTKGGSIAGLTFVSVEILNTNGGIVTGSAAQFESFDTIRFSAGQPSTAISLVLSAAGAVDLTDELLGRRVIFTGTAGNDTITTSNGSDNIDGGAGDDTLSGGLGVDTLIGGLGNDILNGGDGIDFIVDLSGVMAIDAGDGDDVMTVGAAVSSGTIAGGLGIDQLNKGGAINGLTITGIEIVNTNGGTLLATAAQFESFDTIRFSAALATTAVSLALADAGTVDLTDELLGRRALFAGSSGNDVITTSNGSDQIDGGDGNDVLSGGAGVDTLIGGLGDDTLNGGDGGDFIVDLSGVVAIDGGDGDDVITVGAAVSSGTIAGGLGTADQLNKGGAINGITISGIEIVNTNGGTLTATAAQLESFDTIRFSAALPTTRVNLALAAAGTVDLTDELLGGRALVTGSSGDDVITTSNGADTLFGGGGNDTLNGGAGADAVYGDLGDDLIVQGSTDGRDYLDGGAGTDTYQLNGTAAAETFRIMTRAEAVLAGITGLAGATEIVITRDGTDTASVIAELNDIEEIQINTLLTTANNGNGTVDGGASAGDTIIVLGDFTTTSLAYSTIHIAGSNANDTVDISGLTSAHRVVFDANGGSDAFVGEVRPQDVVTGIPGISANFLNTAGIANDFQLMELVNQISLSAASDGVDPFVLLQSGHEMMAVDLAGPADLLLSARDLLTGFDTKDLGSHQIAADYALLQG